MSKPVTITLYMVVDESENPHKWNMAEWLDTDEVVGWDVTDGHPDGCPGGMEETHD